MKNIEKYYDVLLEKQNFFCYVHNEIMKKNTCGNISCFECNKEVLNWLIQEYKEPIKLTEDEKIILKNIDKRYKYIARDYDGKIYIYMEKPIKDIKDWHIDRPSRCENLNFFDNLFQFIKWKDKEPYSIEQLLKEE